MKGLTKQRASFIFSLLVLVTGLAFWLTAGHGSSLWGESEKVIWTQVVVLAFIKARWVVLEFMELRTAPLGLKIACEAWVVGAAASLIAVNWVC